MKKKVYQITMVTGRKDDKDKQVDLYYDYDEFMNELKDTIENQKSYVDGDFQRKSEIRLYFNWRKDK